MGLKDLKGFKRQKAPKKSSFGGISIPKEYLIGAVVLAVLAFGGLQVMASRYGAFLATWEHRCSACKAVSGASVTATHGIWKREWGRVQAEGGYQGDVGLTADFIMQRMCAPKYFKQYYNIMNFQIDGKKPKKAWTEEAVSACKHWTTYDSEMSGKLLKMLQSPEDQQGVMSRESLAREGPLCFQTNICDKSEIRKKLAQIKARRTAGKVSHPMAHSKK